MSDLSGANRLKNARGGESTLFGHPQGLTFLFGTEMWERFSYYGMRSLLVLYMIDYLLKPEKAAGVIGLDGLRRALESIFGQLTDQSFASQIYGFYTGFAYLTPILGGILADRVIGRTATVLLGASLMVLGHFLMAFDHLFLVALFLLVIGVGTFKPNVTTQVGELYKPGDRRIDRAYSIFYVGINIGAFFSPLICGYLGERIAWQYGFISAGLGMALGMATYLIGLPHLPKTDARLSRTEPDEATRSQTRASFASLLLLFIPSALFWAAYEQQGNTIAIWIHQSVNREADLGFWKGEIPVSWFQSINPILIFILTPMLIACWTYFGRRGREPTTIGKLVAGLVLLSLSFVSAAAIAWLSGSGQPSWLWLLIYFVLLTLAELHFSPIGLSLMSSIAPGNSRSSLIAVWFTSNFFGNIIAGSLGGLWPKFSNPVFFLIIAALGAIAALFTLAVRPLLVRTLARQQSVTAPQQQPHR
ncbi:MAG: peptide MFS transporter [Xanthobacteraceae bacterium]|nr:peptide MFS transporter [Xanthobacteraceae bacterium]